VSQGHPQKGCESRRAHRRRFRFDFLEVRNLLSAAGLTRLATAVVQADTHFVPMKGTANGVAAIGPLAIDHQTGLPYVPVTITGSGNISHLGSVTITGSHRTEFIFSGGKLVSSLILDGQATITAANGDEIFIAYSGTGVPTANGFNDTFSYTITGGTGRFSGASGSGVITSTDEPGTPTHVPFVFDLEGVISTVGSSKS
jgi:hypothetical protein